MKAQDEASAGDRGEAQASIAAAPAAALTLTYPAEFLREVLGVGDQNTGFLEQSFGVRFSARGENLLVEGPQGAQEACHQVMDQLLKLHQAGIRVGSGDLRTAFALRAEGHKGDLLEFYREAKVQCSHGRVVFPKGLNQGRYLREIREKDVVFGIGPAGTGKTYLAVAMAVSALKEKRVKRIILTRPAVEAGEKLGYLPGDIAEKVNPYLRPLYDALFDLMEGEKVYKYLETGILEIAPIAFMRGRTLNDSFVILDEAQNTTIDQMKMFLTRLGFNSKTVVTGDITQIDIDPSRKSGLVDAADVLREVQGLGFVFFTERDVVRHPLVQQIIRAYEKASGR
jgi:phosphate starvation-inducible protein PhoH and related proteins